jgi:uncharacterized protein YndB with AHSA1/START domain
MSDIKFTVEPGKQEAIIIRTLNAPRDLVFKTMTDPKHLPNWWGPKYLTTTVDKMEVKPGGCWRYVQRDPEGNEYAFRGVYHDVIASERLVYTFEYEGMPGHVLMEIVTFEDYEGKTKLTDHLVFQSVEDRDGMYNTGMQEGATESMNRLAELVEAA